MRRKRRIRAIALLCSIALFASPAMPLQTHAEGENCITNSTFDSGTKDWNMHHHKDADAALTSQDGVLALQINALGAVNYAVQLQSNAVTLAENACYQLDFDISCTQERYVDAVMQQNGSPYQAYAAEGLNLTQEMQHITLTFRMEYPTSEAMFILNCGNHQEPLAAHTIYLDNVTLIEVDENAVEQYNPYESPICINQVGYHPDAQKIAVFRGITDETEFSVVDAKSGKTVHTGTLYGKFNNEASGEINYYGDFSEVTEAGSYYITCGALDDSYTFTIGETVYAGLLDALVRMFYLQRCGCEVEDAVYGHPACHAEKATILGTEQKIDVCGGWHDAGDYGRYVVPACKAVADLLLAYSVNPSIHSDKIGIPESGNGIPDILDEVRYAMDWMLKMQSESGGVYHKVNCGGNTGSVMPDKELTMQYVSPVSTLATADFCAVTAMAAEVYADIDKAFAASCLAASKAAWKFLEAHPDLIYVDPTDLGDTNGGYQDSRDGDERYWAACQLYRVTGDAQYLDAIANIKGTYYKDGLEWQSVGHYGNFALLTMEDADTPHHEKALEMVNNWVNEYTKTAAATGYRTGNSRFTWGSNMTVANTGILLCMADRIKGNQENADLAGLQLDYLLGRNPNGICYVTGFGTASPQNPHHRPSIVKKQPMPGMLVGGVNSDLADETAKKHLSDAPPAKCYVDDSGSFSTNEITIYWNSPAVYLLSLLMDETESGARGDVNADGKFSVLDVIALQKWLLCDETADVVNWKAGDLCEDGVLNAFDLAALKRELLKS